MASKPLPAIVNSTPATTPTKRYVDIDILVLVADELTFHGRHALLPLLHANRAIYDLCSHLLLRNVVRIHVGGSSIQWHLECFGAFLFNINCSESRLRRLQHLEICLANENEEESMSEQSFASLLRILEHAEHLETLGFPYGVPAGNVSSLSRSLNQLTRLQSMTFCGPLTPMIFPLIGQLSLSLTKLVIQLRTAQFGNAEEMRARFYPLLCLAPLASTLTYLDVTSDYKVDFSGPPVQFSAMKTLAIRASLSANDVLRGPLISLYPKLRQLHIEDVHIPWDFTEALHQENTDTELANQDSWPELESLSGPVHVLYGLALASKVHSLCILVNGFMDEDENRLIEVCRAARPSILHITCVMSINSLSVLSTVIGASGAATVRIHLQVEDQEFPVIPQYDPRTLLDNIHVCLEGTSVTAVSVFVDWDELAKFCVDRSTGVNCSEPFAPPYDCVSISGWLRKYPVEGLMKRLALSTPTLRDIFIEIFQYPRRVDYWRNVEGDEGTIFNTEKIAGSVSQLLDLEEKVMSRGCICDSS